MQEQPGTNSHHEHITLVTLLFHLVFYFTRLGDFTPHIRKSYLDLLAEIGYSVLLNNEPSPLPHDDITTKVPHQCCICYSFEAHQANC